MSTLLRHLHLAIAALLASAASAQTPFRTDFRRTTDVPTHLRYDVGRDSRAFNASGDNGMGRYGESGRGSVASIGSPVVPVIMVAFADADFLPTTDVVKVSRWLNEEGYSDERFTGGSVADYFRDNSYGLFTPHFDVVDRVTVSQPLAYYGAHGSSSNDIRPGALVQEAIGLAMSHGVNFDTYATDGNVPIVGIIHAGPGEHEDMGYKFGDPDCDNYIWAHHRSLGYTTGGNTFRSYIICNEAMRNFVDDAPVSANMTGIGTFCHEFCHALGLPDTYDVDGGTPETLSHTPGIWDVMDYQFMLNGYRPGCLNAYERCMLGWLELEELPIDGGIVTLHPLDGDLGTATPHRAYRITNPVNASEYLVLENRQPSTWHVSTLGSSVILGSGMLVWHIDYSASAWSSNSVNTNFYQQHISVVPADGEWQEIAYSDNDGDLFPGSMGVTTLDSSVAKFNTGTFDTIVHDITQQPDGTITFRVGTITHIDAAPDGTAARPYGIDLWGRPSQQHGISIGGGRKTMR